MIIINQITHTLLDLEIGFNLSFSFYFLEKFPEALLPTSTYTFKNKCQKWHNLNIELATADYILTFKKFTEFCNSDRRQ